MSGGELAATYGVPSDVHRTTVAVPRSIITRVTRYIVGGRVTHAADKANRPTYPAPPCTARCSWL